jgi:hypothetical protein
LEGFPEPERLKAAAWGNALGEESHLVIFPKTERSEVVGVLDCALSGLGNNISFLISQGFTLCY